MNKIAANGLGSEPSAGSKYMDKECKSTPTIRANALRKSRLLNRSLEAFPLSFVITQTRPLLLVFS